MISNGEKFSLSYIKKLAALLRGITFKHHGDFYCLNCLHSFATEKKLELQKKVCENKDFCNVIMPSKDTKKLINIKNLPFIIYTYLECIIEKFDEC